MKKNVFILDDMPILSRMYCEVLARRGYHTEVVSTSDEAWTKLQEGEAPACLILDVMVPGSMNGIELCRKLRSVPRFERVPIVMLTANSASRIEEEARAAGCDAFFSKPCKINALIEVVDSLTSVPGAAAPTAADANAARKPTFPP